MTKAEEAAIKTYPKFLEYYPKIPSSTCGPDGFTPTVTDHNAYARQLFQQGYEQAEQDLALTPDDIRQIIKINYEIIFQDTTGIKCGNVAEETLKRFNQWKEEQK